MNLVKRLRFVQVILVLLLFVLASLVALGYWQSNYGYFVKFTPIPKPEKHLTMAYSTHEYAIASQDRFIRLGFSLDKNDFWFIDILPEYDYNFEYVDHLPPDYKINYTEYYHMTITYHDPPLKGVPDVGQYVEHFWFWLIATCFTALGVFAAKRYLKDIEI